MVLLFLWSQIRLLGNDMIGLQLLRVMDGSRKKNKEIVRLVIMFKVLEES